MKKKEITKHREMRDWAKKLAIENYIYGNTDAGKRWEEIARKHSDALVRETRMMRLWEKRRPRRKTGPLHSITNLFRPKRTQVLLAEEYI